MDYITEEELPSYGLCSCSRSGYIDESILDIFCPTVSDDNELEENGYCTVYWASGDEDSGVFKFTSLRQTIVLFMACLNGEL